MLHFNATILKFGRQGEKTGWTYILVPNLIAQQLYPNNKKAFRVKGFFNEYGFETKSLVPMGGGDFILALNASVRKAIRKTTGDEVLVKLELDLNPPAIPAELMECLKEEPLALEAFNKLPQSHQNYFSHWIDEAKTNQTKSTRIAAAINALLKGFNFPTMLKLIKQERELVRGLRSL